MPPSDASKLHDNDLSIGRAGGGQISLDNRLGIEADLDNADLIFQW